MIPNPVIKSIGIFIPENRESNYNLLERFEINEQFITKKIGVETRAIKDKKDETSDLCIKAFHDLCRTSQIDLSQINLLCVVTQNPDQKIPHTAAIVHQKLGLDKSCMTFDISQGCAGFPHGIAIVSALMRDLNFKNALLFTCDPYSKIVNPNDKNTSLLFGDAATATLMTNQDDNCGYTLVNANFGTLQNSYSCLTCTDSLQMSGRDIVSYVLKEVPGSIRELLLNNNLKIQDIDLFVLHQASRTMVELLRENLNVNEETAPFEIMEIGNTVSSSIPIVLKKHVDEKTKKHILISGFGVGFSFASSLLKLVN